MGLDFGSKTVGVAISDPLFLTAQGIEIVRRKSQGKLRQTLARIEELKEEYEKKDPVAVAERQLLAAGWLTPEETAALKKQYADEVQLAVATAQREPEPDPFREDWNATVWRPY